MSEVIYKFDSHEDRNDLEIIRQGPAMHAALWDMTIWLRSNTEYATAGDPKTPGIKAAEDKLREFMKKSGCDFARIQ